MYYLTVIMFLAVITAFMASINKVEGGRSFQSKSILLTTAYRFKMNNGAHFLPFNFHFKRLFDIITG